MRCEEISNGLWPVLQRVDREGNIERFSGSRSDGGQYVQEVMSGQCFIIREAQEDAVESDSRKDLEDRLHIALDADAEGKGLAGDLIWPMSSMHQAGMWAIFIATRTLIVRVAVARIIIVVFII